MIYANKKAHKNIPSFYEGYEIKREEILVHMGNIWSDLPFSPDLVSKYLFTESSVIWKKI